MVKVLGRSEVLKGPIGAVALAGLLPFLKSCVTVRDTNEEV